MGIAKYLVSGSDLWMNTPRRPMEASGTSGMKAAINGVLNCSILDGWWAEGFQPSLGWAIGGGEFYEDEEQQDEIESKLLYELLEREIIPRHFDRGRDGLPREWIGMMKSSMRVLGAQFASHRMLMEYADQFYIPALENARRITEQKHRGPKDLAKYLKRLDAAWGGIAIVETPSMPDRTLKVGDTLELSARVRLGDLSPEDVTVELYHGPMTNTGEIGHPSCTAMTATGSKGEDGVSTFTAAIELGYAGRQGLAVRVLPRHPELAQRFVPGYVRWG
jgi:starch phosphorylase